MAFVSTHLILKLVRFAYIHDTATAEPVELLNILHLTCRAISVSRLCRPVSLSGVCPQIAHVSSIYSCNPNREPRTLTINYQLSRASNTNLSCVIDAIIFYVIYHGMNDTGLTAHTHTRRLRTTESETVCVSRIRTAVEARPEQGQRLIENEAHAIYR